MKQRPEFNVAVFCGARAGARPEYAASAVALGQELARQDIGIVCGGSRTGLMGALSDASLDAGGYVEGIVPEFLIQHEIAHPRLSQLVRADGMHDRKAIMVERSDAIIVLPGGLGTCDEFFEVFSWAQLGLHAKPIWVLDPGGYFALLREWIAHMIREEFTAPDDGALLGWHSSVPTLVQEVCAFRACPLEERAGLLAARRERLRSLVQEEFRSRAKES
jgi:uncharacterized protein (TIGR00730 family)